MNRPNFDLSPADSRHLPEPSLASFTRTPMRGRTLYFSAMRRIAGSSLKFSTTGMMVRPSLVAMITASR